MNPTFIFHKRARWVGGVRCLGQSPKKIRFFCTFPKPLLEPAMEDTSQLGKTSCNRNLLNRQFLHRPISYPLGFELENLRIKIICSYLVRDIYTFTLFAIMKV